MYRCDLCHKSLPMLEVHSYPYTACDACFDLAGNALRFVVFTKARHEIDEERANMTFADFVYKYKDVKW